MRILFATDGSVAADRARDLMQRIDLPIDSYIRVVGVRRHAPNPYPASRSLPPGDASSFAGSVARVTATAVAPAPVEDHLGFMLDSTVATLEAPDRKVERVVLDGHPGPAIVDEAREMNADLVVVGSRGHGTIESMLLGSVSRHVASHASCSVLVARRSQIRSVLLATDGAADARRAERAIATWPMFAHTTARVVSVAQTSVPMAIGGAPGLYDQVIEQYEEDVDKARLDASSEAESAAQRLTDAGIPATWDEREGDPAGEIVRAATAQDCDLIVTGTQGRTGLPRLLLGSVAANVAGHATASVLIVRGPQD